MTTQEVTVQRKWDELLADTNEHVRRIADRAAREPELRRLFPLASLSNLRFSRVTSYPYDLDLPYILTTPRGEYEARAGNNAPLGTGDLNSFRLRRDHRKRATCPAIMFG